MEEPLSTLPFYLMVLGDSPRNATLPGVRKHSKASEGFEISLEISHCDSIRLSADFASMLMNRHLNSVTNINLKVVIAFDLVDLVKERHDSSFLKISTSGSVHLRRIRLAANREHTIELEKIVDNAVITGRVDCVGCTPLNNGLQVSL